MADSDKGRKAVSKEQFLDVAIPALNRIGVVFQEDGKIIKSRARYWDLFKAFTAILTASAAASGSKVSLAGLGTFYFAEVGRTPETRCKRFKFKLSNAQQKVYKENANLLAPEGTGQDKEAFEKAFSEAFAFIYGSAQEDVIEASDAVTEA